MNLAAALQYWVIVALWLAVLVTVIVFYARNPRGFGTTRLLLAVVIIDTVRNLVENVYFGVYWGGQFGLFTPDIISPLNNSFYVLIVKSFSILAAVLVLGVLLLRWLPAAMREREEIEQRVKVADTQSAMLASALDGASMPVLMIDTQSPQRPVVYANEAYLTRYRKSRTEVIGQPVDIGATIKDNPDAEIEVREAIAKARASKVVVRLRHPDGYVTVNEIALSPVYDARGRTVLLTAVCNDITAARAAVEKGAEANDNGQGQRQAMIGQIAGTIAHDFNNLLTVMLGNLAAAREGLPPQSREGQAVNVSLAAAERSSRLARRLLDYSQNRRSGVDVVDVNAAIEGLHELLRRAVADNVHITLDLTPLRAVCEVDVGRFEDALMNLCINASDAMPKGGTITISTAVETEANPMLVLRVSDTGEGMAPDVQARAFDRYFTTKLYGKGNGLGLPSVRDFAESAGGGVTLASIPGAGTTVTVRLPLVTSAAASAAE